MLQVLNIPMLNANEKCTTARAAIRSFHERNRSGRLHNGHLNTNNAARACTKEDAGHTQRRQSNDLLEHLVPGYHHVPNRTAWADLVRLGLMSPRPR